MAIYPDNSIQFPKKVNLVSDINANDVNLAYSEIEAIETTLGTSIQGVKSSLKDRLSTSMDEFGNLKAGSVGSATIADNSIQNIKLYKDDTFDFKAVNIGQHSGDSLYGFTAGAGVNGTTSGLSVDASGNLNTNGDLFSEGVARFKSNNHTTPSLILDQYGSGNLLELNRSGVNFFTAYKNGTIEITPNAHSDAGTNGVNVKNSSGTVISSHLNSTQSGRIDLYSADLSTNILSINSSSSANDVFIGTITETDLRIKTNDLDRIYIDWQDGNVGINTTSPTVQFEVNGQSKFTGQLNAAGDIITPSINVDNGVFYVDDALNRVGVNTTSPSAAFHVVGDQITTGNQSTSGNLYVTQTVNASGLNIDSGLIYVDSANNRVGINNLSPQYSLDVTGTGNISGNTTVGGTLGVTNTITASTINASGDFAINTDKFKVLAASGNTTVGGTLGVTSLLSGSTASFSGLITSTRMASAGSPFTVASSAMVTNLNVEYLGGQNGAYYQNAGNLNAGTIPSARLSGTYGGITGLGLQTIPLSSSVAIGTAPFTVTSTTKVANLNVDYLDGVSIENIAQTGSAGTIGYISKFTGTSSIANSVIFDDGANKIGINNNSPSVALDVTGDGKFSNTLTVTGSGSIAGLKVDGNLLVTGTEIITLTETVNSSATITGKLTVNGDCQLGDEPTDTVAMSGNATIGGTLGVTNTLTTSAINVGGTLNVLTGTIFTSGASHVGINNPAPAYALDIKTVDTGSGIVLSSSDKALFSAIKSTTGNECDLTLFSGGNPKVYLSTNGESYINNGQFFGIGNSDPGYNLDVTGTGRITGAALIGGTLGVTSLLSGSTATFSGAITSTHPATATTSPLVVANSVLVSNLNVEKLNGQNGAFYQNASNINTGTLADAYVTNALTISGGTINDTPIGSTTANTGKFTTIDATGVITSTHPATATTSPLVVANSVLVSNLNVEKLNGQNGAFYQNASNINTGTLADAYVTNALTISGGTINDTPIGSTTANTGKFTTIDATGVITSTHPATATTSPLVVANSVLVSNLNVEKLNGQNGAFYQNASNINTGTLADAYVTNALTISGGTINDTPIGSTTANTGKFTTIEANTGIKLGSTFINPTWATHFPLKVGACGTISGVSSETSTAEIDITLNAYYNGVWKIATSQASAYPTRYFQQNSYHYFLGAANGSNDSTISSWIAALLIRTNPAERFSDFYGEMRISAAEIQTLTGDLFLKANSGTSRLIINSHNIETSITETKLKNGNIFTMQSDNGVTTKFSIDGSTGNTTSLGKMILPNMEVGDEVSEAEVFIKLAAHGGEVAGELVYRASARRYKTNIEPLQTSEKIYELQPVEFEYKTSLGEKRSGLIAEDVEQVMPELVFYKDNQIEGVNYNKLIPLMLCEIQKLKKEIEELKLIK